MCAPMSTGREVPSGISPKPGPEVVSAHPAPNRNGQHLPSNSSPVTPPAQESLTEPLNPTAPSRPRTVERSRTTSHSHPSIWNLLNPGPTATVTESQPLNPHAVNVRPDTAVGTGSTESPPAPAWLPGHLRPVLSAPAHRGRAHSTALNPYRHCRFPAHVTAPAQSTRSTHTQSQGHTSLRQRSALWLARSHCALRLTRALCHSRSNAQRPHAALRPNPRIGRVDSSASHQRRSSAVTSSLVRHRPLFASRVTASPWERPAHHSASRWAPRGPSRGIITRPR